MQEPCRSRRGVFCEGGSLCECRENISPTPRKRRRTGRDQGARSRAGRRQAWQLQHTLPLIPRRGKKGYGRACCKRGNAASLTQGEEPCCNTFRDNALFALPAQEGEAPQYLSKGSLVYALRAKRGGLSVNSLTALPRIPRVWGEKPLRLRHRRPPAAHPPRVEERRRHYAFRTKSPARPLTQGKPAMW